MKIKLISGALLLFIFGLLGCGTGAYDSNGKYQAASTGTNAPAKVESFRSLASIAAFDGTNFPKMVSALTNNVAPQNIPRVMNLANVAETNVFPTLTNSVVLEEYAALKFVVASYQQDRLPGISKRGQGKIVSDNVSVSHSKAAAYPFFMSFAFAFPGDSFTNHYSVVRPAKDAAWQLEKAWRIDANGRTVKEWPVK